MRQTSLLIALVLVTVLCAHYRALARAEVTRQQEMSELTSATEPDANGTEGPIPDPGIAAVTASAE